MRAIHADPYDTSRPPASEAEAFNEDPSAFRTVRHEIVRPFEADVGHAKICDRARQRHSGDEAELRRDRTRAGIDYEGAGVQISLRRDPGAAPTASPRRLLVGYDPQAIRVAGQHPAAGLLIGRIDGAETNDAPLSRRAVQPGGGGQKSDCAAAIAALVIGEGANTNRMIASAESASTMRATEVGGSNAGAGSSKYMSLTMLR